MKRLLLLWALGLALLAGCRRASITPLVGIWHSDPSFTFTVYPNGQYSMHGADKSEDGVIASSGKDWWKLTARNRGGAPSKAVSNLKITVEGNTMTWFNSDGTQRVWTAFDGESKPLRHPDTGFDG